MMMIDGKIWEFDRATLKSNGVFHNSLRSWLTFGILHLLFLFEHILHGARILFRDIFAFGDPDLER